MTTIGKEKRKALNPWRLELPGVGEYNLQDSEMRKTQGGRFNRAIRSITEAENRSYSSNNQKSFFRRPGPGSYSLELRKKDKIISFPHSKRFATDARMYLPGPGDYKSESCSKQKIKAGIISKSARVTLKLREKLPGPSDYSIPEVSSYKKKEPRPYFNKAKRMFHNTQYEDSGRYNDSKEKIEQRRETERTEARGQTDRNAKMDRVRHGKKIERQARLVQKDTVPV